MERATIGIDVAAVRSIADGDDLRAEGAEQLGAELVGGAVGAVQNDAEIGEIGSGDDAGAEEGEVFGVEGFVGDEGGEIGGGEIGAIRLNVRGCDGWSRRQRPAARIDDAKCRLPGFLRRRQEISCRRGRRALRHCRGRDCGRRR